MRCWLCLPQERGRASGHGDSAFLTSEYSFNFSPSCCPQVPCKLGKYWCPLMKRAGILETARMQHAAEKTGCDRMNDESTELSIMTHDHGIHAQGARNVRNKLWYLDTHDGHDAFQLLHIPR